MSAVVEWLEPVCTLAMVNREVGSIVKILHSCLYCELFYSPKRYIILMGNPTKIRNLFILTAILHICPDVLP